MCQVANVAVERGERVVAIVFPKELGRLRHSPYRLDERVRLSSMRSREALYYFDTGRIEGYRGLVLVDHYVWEVRRQEGHWRLPPYIEDQETVGAPQVPPDWDGMPKGNEWLVVADLWANVGNTEQETLARLHHSLVVSHNRK